jgi:hypothetical protein
VREQQQIGQVAGTDGVQLLPGSLQHSLRRLSAAGLRETLGQRSFNQLRQLLRANTARRLQPEQQGRTQPFFPFGGKLAPTQRQSELAALGDLDACLERDRHLAEGAPHLPRRLQVRLRARGLDGDGWQVAAVASGKAEHAVSPGPPADSFEQLVCEGVFGSRESDAARGHHGQIHALGDRHQPTIDELFKRMVVVRQLQVQPAGVQLHQPADETEGLDWLGRVGGVLDRHRQDAACTWQASQGDDAVREGLKVAPVHAWSAAICACEEAAVVQADQ